MVMTSTKNDCSPTVTVEINGDRNSLRAMAFSPDGKRLFSGGYNQIDVWRVEDGHRVATLQEGNVKRLAASSDGKFIVAGTNLGDVIVWDANTYKQFINKKFKQDLRFAINDVDFSPDATRLLTASADIATIWDISTDGRILRNLSHRSQVKAAKYSPLGDRIATAGESIRIYDSSDGSLLVDIQASCYSEGGLLWFGQYLLVVSGNNIKQIEAVTGSVASEWPFSSSKNMPRSQRIALPKHGKFIACSTKRIVTFWDIATHTQLGLIEHPQDVRSIAFAPDGQSIAIGGEEGKIIIKSLSHIIASTCEQAIDDPPVTQGGHDDKLLDSIPPEEESRIPDLVSISHLTFREPALQIDNTVLDSWKCDRLTNAEELLTAAIATSRNPSHHLLASRSLVRTRLRKWDAALVDAEKAIETRPSVIAYVARSIALIGKDERDKGYRNCDIAFARYSPYVCFLLLAKAIIVFMVGERLDAVSRVDDLIAVLPFNSVYHVVQAYMYLLIGNSWLECNNLESAIESFKHARARLRYDTSQAHIVISLICGWKFENLGVVIQQQLCETLYAAGRIGSAIECLNEMENESGGKMNTREHAEWVSDFRQRSFKTLDHLGDIALDEKRYNEAIAHYTDALKVNPTSPQDVLIKRCKAFMATSAWKLAIDDANEVIMLDPSLPWGYQMKHAVFHNAGDYTAAIDAFETMLSKIAQTSNPDVQQLGDQYISPSSIRATIRKIIQRTIRRSPRVLIDTITGCLYDKAEQASAFESLPIFNELISSMTTHINYGRIKREVRQYFRYVMLSHKWEKNEPLFQQVVCTTVYKLENSPTHEKLKMFCKIARDDGFVWAWSDTCCIDKSDHFVLQEALVAMFEWYQGSALTIVFLRGVQSLSQFGALMRSIWNTRAWTLQEYIASKVIRFYTEDWTLYLDLQLANHKDSQEIISEMEQTTGVPAAQLITLRPGLSSIREKLRLASNRRTTLVEDAAYSLLGIFSVTGLPAIYGEGEGSLGRLLAHVLTGSGDASILAWNGESGPFNSCLPAQVTVFDGPTTSHLPSPIPDAEMEGRINTMQSSFDLDMALTLYTRLSELPAPWFVASRMKLPCIAIELPPLKAYRTRTSRVYRTETQAFGGVKIKTRYDLSRMGSLYLVHPWLGSLLGHEGKGCVIADEDMPPPPSPDTDDEGLPDEELDDDDETLEEEIEDNSTQALSSYPAPSRAVIDREARARRLVACLQQPFGALLVTLVSSGGRETDYRRVAADSMITVQFQENFLLADILDNVRTLDVL